VKLGALLLISAAIGNVRCDTPVGDQTPEDAAHSALGPGDRLRDVQNPQTTICSGAACNGQTVNVTGVVITAVDTFDETHDGKSIGTVFLQDADIAGPLAGISLYAATYVPANLRVAPGDVVNMLGQYNEQHAIGSTVNFGAQFLPQMYKPVVSPSFEMPVPTPLVVTLDDLANFTTARPYLGMLIELDDITVPYAPANDGTGRVHANLTMDIGAPALANELYDLTSYDDGGSFAPNTHFSKIIGILDYFYTFYVCPRSAADLVQ
jgi:hypothetical protein